MSTHKISLYVSELWVINKAIEICDSSFKNSCYAFGLNYHTIHNKYKGKYEYCKNKSIRDDEKISIEIDEIEMVILTIALSTSYGTCIFCDIKTIPYKYGITKCNYPCTIRFEYNHPQKCPYVIAYHLKEKIQKLSKR